MNQSIFFLVFCCATCISFGQPSPRHQFIDPTGTYTLKGERQKREITGNFAEIRVKLIEDSMLAFTMYCNNGYPEYTSGTLIDTVGYFDNQAWYSSPTDKSCQIQFSFHTNGIHIKRVYTDPASTCGFKSGVLPLGFIEKSSSAIPIIQPIKRP